MATRTQVPSLAPLDAALDDVRASSDANLAHAQFIALVAAVRPGKGKPSAAEALQHAIERMEAEPALQQALQALVSGLLGHRDSFSLFTQVGIPGSQGLYAEFVRQVKHRILPPLPNKRGLEYTIRSAFDRNDDYRWVQQVPQSLWLRLFNLLAFTYAHDGTGLSGYLVTSMTALSYAVANEGLEPGLHPGQTSEQLLEGPFLQQNAAVLQLAAAVRGGETQRVNAAAAAVIEWLAACLARLAEIRASSDTHGTSLSQNHALNRTERQIERMEHLVNLLRTDDDRQEELAASVRLFLLLVESENKRNSFRQVFSRSANLVAYQITEHKGRAGEHYITVNWKGFLRMFVRAAAGGVIIALLALVKVLLSHLPLPLFWEYFAYSLNYTLAFVLLQATHTQLATKQPAMTASTLASYLDARKARDPATAKKYFVHAFVQVWRSQTAAFVGNLAVVFPLAYVLSMAYPYLTGHDLLTPNDARKYVDHLDPFATLAWFYAAIMGVYLFLSGVITGFVDNKVRFSNIPGRLIEHPLLRRILSDRRRQRLGMQVDQGLGALAGNIALGFFLGLTPLVGIILGIPFDSRHVTFSTANLAFGIQDMGYYLPPREVVLVTVGVLGIGLFNFGVSFGLAFVVALRSRGLSVQSYGELARMIFRYWRRYPLDFVVPPTRERDLDRIFPQYARQGSRTATVAAS